MNIHDRVNASGSSRGSGVRAVAATSRTVDELARHRSFRHLLARNIRHTLHFRRDHAWHGTPALHLHLNAHLVAGAHGTPKLRAVDPGEHHHFVVAVFYFREQQRAPGLCNGLYNQHAWHDGQARKMSIEERFVDGDILDGHYALFALQLQHAVNEQKGITVRQNLQDVVNVERRLGFGRVGHRRSALNHVCLDQVRLNQPEDYTVPHCIYSEVEAAAKVTVPRKKTRRSAVTTPQAAWADRLRYFLERENQIVHAIRQLVEIESPSDNKPAVDRIAAFLAARFEALRGHTQFHRSTDFGDSLQIDFAGPSKGVDRKPVLLLGHYDTVYPLGTLAKMPCKIENGRLSGPGVLDMKSGIALMLHALEALQAWHGGLLRPVTVLLVSDEEVGSYSSRKITEALARQSAGVLVLEPAAGLCGAVKTARKGVGEYTLRVKGVAAHAGLDPGKGHSAILELARQIAAIAKLNNLRHGLSVNPGVIQGGTRSNVIAAEASAAIDVRIRSAKQAAGIDRKLRSLKTFDQHCKLEITGGINRLPMERTAGVAALYKKAREIARDAGWKLEEAAVGGGSDGNFTAGMGIPTLDGLGGVGNGAHAAHEFIVISELPRRALLLAGMIENV